MKHVMYGDKNLLMDDASADALIEYAAALGDASKAATVTLKAVGEDGHEVDVTFLLNAASVLVVETASGTLNAPSNDEIVAWMREKTQGLMDPPRAEAEDPHDARDFEMDEYH